MSHNLKPSVRFGSVAVLLASFLLARSPDSTSVSAILVLAGAFLIAREATIILFVTVLLPFSFVIGLVTVIVCTNLVITSEIKSITPEFYLLQLSRVIGISATTVALIGTLTPSQLLQALRGIGIPINTSLLLVSPLVLLEGFREQARAIVDCRLTHGHVKRRTRFNVALQLLPSMRILIAYAFISAIERHDMWLRDGIVNLTHVVSSVPSKQSRISVSDVIVVIATSFVAALNLQVIPCTLF